MEKIDKVMQRFNDLLLAVSKSTAIDSGDLDAATLGIVEAACEGLGVKRASIWRLEKEKGSIRCTILKDTEIGISRDPLELTPAQFPNYFKELYEERTIVAHDAVHDPATCDFAEVYLKPLGITSMLDAPIRNKGEMVGILCCEHVGPQREWSLAEQTFSGALADLVGRALNGEERHVAEEKLKKLNLELEDRVKARTRELEETLDNLKYAQEQLVESEKYAGSGCRARG